MKNSDYWTQRFKQLEKALHQMGEEAFKEDIERQYREAQKQIEADIARWYQRLAANNNISLAEARKFLRGADLKEFKWDVWDYIKYGDENAINGQWMKELENASAKFHISRLEALKIQTQHSLEAMFAKQNSTVSDTMAKVYESSYYHTAFEIQKGVGVGWDIAGVNQSQIEKVLSKPWALDKYNFSERIWSNKEKLINEIHGTLTQNIMLGQDPQKAIDAIAKKMNTSKYNAGRLVMTEEAAFAAMAQKECYKELDVEKFEVIETFDAITCEMCGEMDGKVFPMSEYQVGLNVPPFHPNCRGCTAPWFEDDFGVKGERAARDIKTGETYYVPADMSFEEWKKSFADGGENIDKSAESGIIKNTEVVKSGEKVDKVTESGIIENSEISKVEIGQSLGAASKNYSVKLPDGRQHTKLAENQDITGKAFAGKGTSTPIRERFRLEAEYDVPADEWQKMSGKGKIVVEHKIRFAELHWYEANGEIVEMKVKRYLDES